METDYFHYTTATIQVLATDGSLTVVAVVSFFLLLFASLVAGAEVAVLALSAGSLVKIEGLNDTRSQIIKKYIKDPDRLRLTVSIATFFIIVVVFLMFLPFIGQITSMKGFNWFFLLVLAFVFTLIILVFTELIPRIFGKIAESYIYAFAFPIRIIEVWFSPVSIIIEKMTGNQGKRIQNGKHQISIEDISSALEYTTDENSDEEDILQGIVNFGNMDVQKIVKPRIDVIAVDKDTDPETLYKIIVDSGYSRIPVFSETFDNIAGILYVKDLLPHLKELHNFDWNSLIRPPYFVPETKKVKELLKELQAQKIHMAIVIDEYGGTTGIVTLEDILEEIVGEIADESDEDEEIFRQIDENTFVFDGFTPLTDFYDITQSEETIFDEVRGDADTLAGLIMELTGEIPENGDEAEFGPFKFVVEQVDNRRIKQIRVIISKKEEPDEAES